MMIFKNLVKFLIQGLQGVRELCSTWSFRVSDSFYHVLLLCPVSLFRLHGKEFTCRTRSQHFRKVKRGLPKYDNISFPGHIVLAKFPHMTYLTSKVAKKCSQAEQNVVFCRAIILLLWNNRRTHFGGLPSECRQAFP